MADQRALYDSIHRFASGSQEARGRKQKAILLTLVGLVLAATVGIKVYIGDLAPASNVAPVVDTSPR
jgi:hypothetical protein